MFESVKIGLSYMKDKCDTVLLTPVDIPLFTAQTVRGLMDFRTKLACPVCNGRIRHPNLIHVSLIGGILQDCSALLKYHNRQLVRPEVHVVLSREGKLLRCFNRWEQRLRDEANRLFDDCFAEIFNTQRE